MTADPLIGRVLDGRYRVDERIGQGGMGAVYRGRHMLMDQRIALKVLRPDKADDQAAARRFLREARSTFKFDQQNCVRVTDVGASPDGVLYLVMEYLDGRTVADELHIDGPMAPLRVAHVGRQICDALACAHALGFVHRDLKPDNLMLLRRGDDPDFVKVLDFGLAKIFDESGGALTTAFSISPLTQEGTIFGTPEYMSPEQATGKPLDPRTDLYSLGVVMYQMLTGLLPFQAASFLGILTKHVQDQPVAPATRRPELGIPAPLDTAVMHCLAKRPDQRPATARELSGRLAELERTLGRSVSRVPQHLAASATVDLSSEAVAAAGPAVSALPTRDLLAAASRPLAAEPVRRGRRGLLPLAGFLALAAGLTVLVVATRNGGDRAAAPPAEARSEIPAAVAAVEPAVADAGLVLAPADALARAAAPPPPDAAARPIPRRPAQEPERRADPTVERVARHLEAAEAARASGNTLKQMAEADTALRLDRRSTRAAWLFGDALVASGDAARGCQYLQRARNIAQARTRWRDAGCDGGSGD